MLILRRPRFVHKTIAHNPSKGEHTTKHNFTVHHFNNTTHAISPTTVEIHLKVTPRTNFKSNFFFKFKLKRQIIKRSRNKRINAHERFGSYGSKLKFHQKAYGGGSILHEGSRCKQKTELKTIKDITVQRFTNKQTKTETEQNNG